MNIKDIRELAQILKEKELSRLEFVDGDTKIVLEKPAIEKTQFKSPSEILPNNTETAPPDESIINSNELFEVKSPIVGVFYTSPSPGSPPFVSIGAAIKKGDVLCIVEAMKVLNEIVAERDGEIADICLKNGDIAEYGQVLFKIR